jgi:phenylacetate-CoA ligase
MGPDVFLVVDNLTGRALNADEVQMAVMNALDGTRTVHQIAEEILGDVEGVAEVESFVAKLHRLYLLDEGVSHEEIRARQGEAFRAIWVERVDKSAAKMLAWARQVIPFYRDTYTGLTPLSSVADLGSLPTMTKRDIRENFPSRLLPEGIDLDALQEKKAVELAATSGTSDERLEVVFDMLRPGYHFSFPGVDAIEGGWGTIRMALFTTPICSGAVCHLGGSPYEERLRNPHDLTFNSSDRVMRLTRAEVLDVEGDWKRFEPHILRCDPVYAVALVRAFQREGIEPPPLAGIWTGFEYCSVLHRDILSQGFKAPVYTYYGGTDVGGSEAAFLCERGRYHVREEAYWLDFVRDGRAAEDGELSAILVTSLRNNIMPVIRYRIGDLGRPRRRSCDCSHDYWTSFDLEGRIKDLIVGKDRLITTREVDDLFIGLKWLDYYQLIQHSANDFELLGVRRDGTDEADAAVWSERARTLLGEEAKIRIRYVREIPPEKSLKYRLTASKIWSPDDFR